MKLVSLIRETFELDPNTAITNVAEAGELDGWDSLGHVRLMSALESTYGISIEIEEMMEIEKVEDIRRILERKGVKDF